MPTEFGGYYLQCEQEPAHFWEDPEQEDGFPNVGNPSLEDNPSGGHIQHPEAEQEGGGSAREAEQIVVFFDANAVTGVAEAPREHEVGELLDWADNEKALPEHELFLLGATQKCLHAWR